MPLSKPEKVESQLLKNLSFLDRRSSIENPLLCHSESVKDGRRIWQTGKSNHSQRDKSLIRKPDASAAPQHDDYRAASIKFDRVLFRPLQEQITAYFEGVCVNFNPDFPIILDGFSLFTGLVLAACRQIGFGQTITYSALAERIGRTAAARAVGNALAKNPLPLIIPCHRVVRTDGSLGGFFTPGGKKLKEKLLRHELAALTRAKDGPDRAVLQNLLL